MELVVGGRNPHVVMTVKCSQCGTQRQQTNHWFVMTVIEGALMIEAYDDKLWGLHDGEHPVCGQSCAQKKLEKFLQAGKL